MHLPVAFFPPFSSSSCSVSIALRLPHLSSGSSSLPAHFPRFLSPHLSVLYLHCPLLHNQRSLLLNPGLRQLTFMRLDILVQPHSYVQ